MIGRRALQVIGVILLISAALVLAADLLTPTWNDWNTDNTVKGFYKEPKNRIQAVFLGRSGVVNGISPMTLYDNFGICAYNLASPEQPMLASYYWIKEAERLHPETLKAVVLDLSSLFSEQKGYAFAERSLARMKLSPVKAEAFRSCEEEYDDFSFPDHIFPLTAYHSRWPLLSRDDFSALHGESNYFYTRGQNVDFGMSVNLLSASNILLPLYKLTPEQDHSPDAFLKEWNATNLRYFNKITEYCSQNGLDLILICTPLFLTDLQHDSMQYLADAAGVPLIDFNMPDLQAEIGLNFAYDYKDRLHANYYGAEKFTDHIGRFITDNYDIEDVRGSDSYEYLKNQSDEYAYLKEDARLQFCDDLEEYLRIIGNDRFTTFLSVKNDGASGLSGSDRQELSDLGFSRLAELGSPYSYVGIRDQGRIAADMAGNTDKDYIVVQGVIDSKGSFSYDGVYIRSDTAGIATPLTGEKRISVISEHGLSSVNIDNKEYSENGSGLNFVVYDNKIGQFIDSSCFDTRTAEKARTDLAVPASYTVRLERATLQNEKSFRDYVSRGLRFDQRAVILFGTFHEPSSVLSEEDIAFLKSAGLSDAEKILTQPYAAVLQDGKAIAEAFPESGTGEILVMDPDPFFYLISAGPKENTVIIDNTRLTVDDSCLLVLICTGDGKTVIDQRIIR